MGEVKEIRVADILAMRRDKYSKASVILIFCTQLKKIGSIIINEMNTSLYILLHFINLCFCFFERFLKVGLLCQRMYTFKILRCIVIIFPKSQGDMYV